MIRKRKLKLFVWDFIFRDYTSGMAAVLAYDADHARRLLIKEHRKENGSLFDDDAQRLKEEPVVATRPKAFYVYGGS